MCGASRDVERKREREEVKGPGVNDWSSAPLSYAPDGVH